MADTFTIGASDHLNLHSKGKKHHRRTQSTLNLEIEGLTPKRVNREEIIQEFLEAPDTLDADITQKILDVSIDLESDRQVLVDDINEVPSKGAIVPKLNFNVNPLEFNKRRNLSAATAPINNVCPVRKIDLFSNLQNIDNLTGLDTIYEKRGSIESVDIETLEARQSTRVQPIEQNANKLIRESLKEIKPNHSKHPSADLPDTHSGHVQLISAEERRTHSRQSSADLAYSRLNQTAKEQSIKFMKPTHSKHSSIDLNKRNSKQGKAEINLNSITTTNRTNLTKPTHNKQCSLNFSPSHVKQPSLTIQPTSTSRLNRNNNKSYHYNYGITLPTQMSDSDKPSKSQKKSQKKSFETQNFYIMPSRINEPVPKSPKNKSLLVERNKFITELQKVTLENMKAKKMRENVTPHAYNNNTKHERNISSTSRSAAASKHLEQQRAYQQMRNAPQKHLSGFQERGLNKSISPMRNVANISANSDSKQSAQARTKRAEIKSFKEVINCRAMPLSEERVNTMETIQSRTPYNPKSLYPENPYEKLVEKTNALEGQVTDILHVVSSFMNEEVQLKEKIKTQEDQIKSLEDMLVKYEREVNTLKAGAICKTEPCNNETKVWMRKDKSETRLMTTTDTSAYESGGTENSGQLISKTSRRNRKISPFTIHIANSNIQSAKNEARKINEGLLSEYKNLMKKRQLSQKKSLKQ